MHLMAVAAEARRVRLLLGVGGNPFLRLEEVEEEADVLSSLGPEPSVRVMVAGVAAYEDPAAEVEEVLASDFRAVAAPCVLQTVEAEVDGVTHEEKDDQMELQQEYCPSPLSLFQVEVLLALPGLPTLMKTPL